MTETNNHFDRWHHPHQSLSSHLLKSVTAFDEPEPPCSKTVVLDSTGHLLLLNQS